MSEYIFFYVRAENRMMPIGSFSRSNNVFQLFRDCAPYEKIAPLDAIKLDDVYGHARGQIELAQEELAREKEVLQLIPTFSNSVEDKLEALQSQQELLVQLEDDLNEWRGAAHYVEFLRRIVETAEDTNWMEDKALHLNPHRYLWVGIETGYELKIPTA